MRHPCREIAAIRGVEERHSLAREWPPPRRGPAPIKMKQPHQDDPHHGEASLAPSPRRVRVGGGEDAFGPAYLAYWFGVALVPRGASALARPPPGRGPSSRPGQPSRPQAPEFSGAARKRAASTPPVLFSAPLEAGGSGLAAVEPGKLGCAPAAGRGSVALFVRSFASGVGATPRTASPMFRGVPHFSSVFPWLFQEVRYTV